MYGKIYQIAIIGAVSSAAMCPNTAFAAPSDIRASLTASAETQELSRGFGSLRTLKLEYKDVLDDTTVVASPTAGFRKTSTGTATALGGGIEVYHNWNARFSTRTAAFVSEAKPVFAKIDLAQDISVAVVPRVTVTAGVRWAEYDGDQKVLFVSGGARRYFRGGSIAYRLTYIKPKTSDGYVAHLVNLSLNDRQGRGKSQIWLSAGNSSIERSQLETNFKGDDYGALVRRVQPISDKLDIVFSAGLSAYGHPGGRVWGKTIGLGLAFGI